MQLPLSFDAAAEEHPLDAPIVWRRVGAGTFWFVESRAPEGFRIDLVTEEGKRANLTEAVVGDHVYPAGRFYCVTIYKEGVAGHSPFYPTLPEAKSACESYRRFRVFPPKK
jgi:hypothetical protein